MKLSCIARVTIVVLLNIATLLNYTLGPKPVEFLQIESYTSSSLTISWSHNLHSSEVCFTVSSEDNQPQNNVLHSCYSVYYQTLTVPYIIVNWCL